MPLVLGAHADGEPPVAGLEGLVGHKVGVGAAHAAGRDAGQCVVPLIHERGQRRVPQRDVDTGTFSGLLAMVEGGENGGHGVHAGHDVNPRHADLSRAGVGIAGDGHDAAAGLHGQVKRHLVAPGSVLAVTGDAADNGFLRDLADDGVKGPGFEVLDHNIVFDDERPNAGLLLLDVDRFNALASVAR